jgi:hypothetical protein
MTCAAAGDFRSGASSSTPWWSGLPLSKRWRRAPGFRDRGKLSRPRQGTASSRDQPQAIPLRPRLDCLLSGTAAAITSELDALVFTPNTFDATTTFTLTDTTSVDTSAANAKTTVTVTNGEPVVVSVSTFEADQATLDLIPGGFDILDNAADISADLNQLDDPHIDAFSISRNGEVTASVQQLTSDATAIGKLENANLSPTRCSQSRIRPRILNPGCRRWLRNRARLPRLSRPRGRSLFRRPHSWPISWRSTRSSAASRSPRRGQCGGEPQPAQRSEHLGDHDF